MGTASTINFEFFRKVQRGGGQNLIPWDKADGKTRAGGEEKNFSLGTEIKLQLTPEESIFY